MSDLDLMFRSKGNQSTSDEGGGRSYLALTTYNAMKNESLNYHTIIIRKSNK